MRIGRDEPRSRHQKSRARFLRALQVDNARLDEGDHFFELQIADIFDGGILGRFHSDFTGERLRNRCEGYFEARNFKCPILAMSSAQVVSPLLWTVAKCNHFWREPVQRDPRHQRMLEARADGRLCAMKVPTGVVLYEGSFSDLHTVDLDGRSWRSAWDRPLAGFGFERAQHQKRNRYRHVATGHGRTSACRT